MAAIYMWPLEFKLVLTTTPYPVDVTDAIVLGIAIDGGAMELPPYEEIEGSVDLVNGYWYQARWFYTDGPYDDSCEADVDLPGGYWYQARWFYTDGPYDDACEASVDLPSGYWLNKLVLVDTPDELLQLSCVVDTTSSMT